MSVTLNHGGVAAIAKSGAIQALVNKAANDIAENVRSQGIRVGAFKGGKGDIDLPVTVTSSTTDRAEAHVTIAHPSAIAVQAKHGALTRAASQAGLSVR